MILPDHMIRARVAADGLHMVEPFVERTVHNGMSFGLSCAGYDVRCKQKVVIQPGYFALASTVERFAMPADVLAVVHDKSTWARRGLSVFNTVIEPGWVGFLTLELANHGTDPVVVSAGDPIAQILFHQLAAPVERAYAGKYQDQPDRPVAAMTEACA